MGLYSIGYRYYSIILENWYYLPVDAQLNGRVIRQHWGIENQVHWTLDRNLPHTLDRQRF